MEDCVFCKIVKGEIPSSKVFEDDDFVVFKDIKPSAPTHLLIVTKKHVSDISEADEDILIKIRNIALKLQKELRLEEFQLKINWGKLLDINHLHAHFLAGIEE